MKIKENMWVGLLSLLLIVSGLAITVYFTVNGVIYFPLMG